MLNLDMAPKPIVVGECSNCGVKSIVFEKHFVSVWELADEFMAITLCPWCLTAIIADVDLDTAKYMASRGVKIFSWVYGELVLDEEGDE